MSAEYDIEDVKRRALKENRYKRFKFLDKPEDFSKIFAGKHYFVQVHDASPAGKGITGFAGAFTWKAGKLFPEDNDSYNAHCDVYGYAEFEVDSLKYKGLDIIASNW